MSKTNNAKLPFSVLFGEQLRFAASSIVRQTGFVPALFAAVGAFMIIQLVVGGDNFSIPLEPGHLMATLPFAVLLPWSMWKAEPVFGRAFLWTLPVSRQRVVLGRVIAGGLCLLTALLVLLALVALVTGGFGTRNPAAPWQWIPPFTGNLIVYTAASAGMLGLKHKVRWVALLFGFWLVLALLVGMMPSSTVAPVAQGALDFWFGRFGPDYALTGGSGSVPALAHWIEATLLWGAAALASLALAIRRHREG